MNVIRRELPRTENAGRAVKARRTKHRRVLLAVFSSTATNAALRLAGCGSLIRSHTVDLGCRVFRFGFDSNGPDKSEQLAADSGYDLRLDLAGGEKLAVTAIETVLSLPGDLDHSGTETNLALQQVAATPGSELVGPGGFDDDSSQVSVSRFGDAALQPSRPARVLAGHQAAVGHQLSRFGEARDLASSATMVTAVT